MQDKITSEKLVELLEEVISKRSETLFAFEPGSERSVQLVEAYALIDRSKTFLRKQKDKYGLNPHDFIIEVFEMMMKEPSWRDNITTLRFVRNDIGGYAQKLFEKKKQESQLKKAAKSTFIDYSVMMPEWN